MKTRQHPLLQVFLAIVMIAGIVAFPAAARSEEIATEASAETVPGSTEAPSPEPGGSTEAPPPQPEATESPLEDPAPGLTDAPSPEPSSFELAEPVAPPSITSDKADYAPGELVTLSGAGWQPGESVHLFVNDHEERSWSHDADTLAAEDGSLRYAFNLPDWFVANYSVLATGELSGTARTTFTDSVGSFLSGTSSTGTCTNPERALANDGSRAACSSTQDVVVSGYGLFSSVPATAQNISFKVEIDAHRTGTDTTIAASLSWDGGGTFTAGINTANYGSSSDSLKLVPSSDCSTFGRTWTPAELTDTNFRVKAQANGSGIQIDRVQVAVCYSNLTAAVAGASRAVASPGGAVKTQVRSDRLTGNWRATGYEVEGQSQVCVNHSNESGSGTQNKGFDIVAPGTAGTYDITFKSYATDTSGACGSLTASYTLTDALTVGIFGDSFGVSDNDEYTAHGWTDGDGDGGDCEVRNDDRPGILTSGDSNAYLRLADGCAQTKTGISTAGLSNIHLSYDWGQETDSASGTLKVEWRIGTGAWSTLNDHALTDSDGDVEIPNSADVSLGSGASNTTISVRFTGVTSGGGGDDDDDEGGGARALVDNVLLYVGTPTNAAPVCDDVQITTDEDVQGSIAPDCTDADGDTLTYSIVTDGASGSASIDATTDDLLYDPDLNFNGSDSFTYKANDGTDDSAAANVTVTVNATNDAPTCDDVQITTDEDTQGSVAPDCTDIDGDSLTYSVVTDGASGSASVQALTDNLLYDPDLNFNGSDSFTYKANDGTIDSAAADVDVTVNAVQDVPVCDDVQITTDEDVQGSIAPDCTDADGDTLTYSIVTDGASGSASIDATTDDLLYDPDLNFNGSDSFTYKANDGTDDSAAANVTVTVNATNDAPTCDDVQITTDEDTQGSVAPDCTDIDGDSLTYSVVTDGASGSASVQALTDNLLYDPDLNFNGSDSFTYKANDGTIDSAAADVDVTVNAVQDVPVCDDVQITTDEDVQGSIAPDCTDADGDTLTYSIVTDGASGSASIDATTDDLLYDPDLNFNGSDSFTYKANDGTDDSAAANVTVTVNATNDAPTCDDVQITTDEDTQGSVAPDCTDIDGDSLTYSVVTDGASGSASVQALTDNLLYDPDLNFNGSDSFTYKANDGTIDSAAADVDVTVNAVQDVPVCDDVQITTDEDVQGSIAPDCTDADGDTLTYSIVTDGASGSASIDATTDDLLYDPDLNFNGSDSFTYKANDGTDDSAAANVTVTVNSVNDLPVVTNDRAMQHVIYSDSITAVNVSASDVETDPADLVATAEWKLTGGTFVDGLFENLTLTAGVDPGEWIISGTADVDPGLYVIRVTVTDEDGGEGYTEFSMRVWPEGAMPTAGNGAFVGSEYYWVPSNGTSATVTLGASIKEIEDSLPGDIRDATVSFWLRNSAGGLTTISGAQNLAVGLVDPDVITEGTAAKTLQLSLKSGEICQVYTIAITVGGSYVMEALPHWDTLISVCKATPGAVIANGVQFLNTGASGFLGDPSETSTLNFDVKYNSKGTNPQGKVSVSFDSNRNTLGLVDGNTHTYYIKSTAISTFNVFTSSKTSSFTSKATVQELVCNPVCSMVSLDGGAILQVDAKDGGANGAGDTIGVTVNKSSKSGGLWFSSQWVGGKTTAKPILLGDILI